MLALITGGNRGLGKETARQLARRGVDVLLGSRDPQLGQEAARELAATGLQVAPVRVDVTRPASVKAVAADIERDYGTLDVLVNNAGVFVGRSAADTSADDMQRTFEVNVFGAVTAIGTLLPLLRRSSAPRIVNVSSNVGSLTLTSEDADIPGDASRRLAYACSKAALNMLTAQYALAFRSDPALAHVKINSATPGYTATRMNDFTAPRSVAEGARSIVAAALLSDDGPSGRFLSEDRTLPW